MIATWRRCNMPTHTDTSKVAKKTRPPWLRKTWAVLATLAALACAFVVIGKFSWGSELYDDDSYWVSADAAFLAGLGVIGFAGLAIRMWQAPREVEPLWSKWVDVVFWTYFAAGMVFMVVSLATEVGEEDGIEWSMLSLLGFFAILTVWGAAESWMKAWKASHPDPGHGAAAH
jgi:hypothetical protein